MVLWRPGENLHIQKRLERPVLLFCIFKTTADGEGVKSVTENR